MFARRSEVQPLVAPAARSCCKPATCVALTAGISGICFGYEIGIVDSVLAMDTFRLSHGTSAIADGGIIEPTGAASSVDGSIVSLFLCGCCLGSVGASYCADAFGRKACLVIGSILFTLGGICQALSNGLALLYFGRLLAGCGIGVLSMVAPLFISETSSKQSRGVLISTQQLLITVGIFLASCINSLLYAYGKSWGDVQWRIALSIQAVPGLVLLAAVHSVPASPRWLVLVGREKEAHGVVALLRNISEDDPSVAAEVAGIVEELGAEGLRSSGEGKDVTSLASWASRFQGLFRVGALKRTIAVCAVQFFQQWSGINAILYFAAALFLRAGVSKDTASTSLVVGNAALLVAGTIPGMWAVDKESIGRRRLLLWGSLAMAVCHAFIAALVFMAEAAEAGTARADALSYSAVASMFAFTFFFSATWGPVAWVLSSEVFDLKVRAQGVALGTVFNWASNAIIGKVTPLLFEAVGGLTFLLFCFFCLASFFYVYAFIPETAGVALEDMALVFKEGAAESVRTLVKSYQDNGDSEQLGLTEKD